MPLLLVTNVWGLGLGRAVPPGQQNDSGESSFFPISNGYVKTKYKKVFYL